METPISQSNEQKVLHALVSDILEMKKQIHDLTTKKVMDELQLPEDILNDSGILPQPPTRLKSKGSRRPLLESEILEAQQKNDCAAACARYLGVDYTTYKKYAIKYGIFKTNPWGKGSKKRYWDPNKGKYPLNKILNGEFPNYPAFRLKDLLIRSGTKKAECEQCGFSEKRITDEKMPLVLNFEDGDPKNHKLENIKLLCYNCTFICGRGYIRNNRVDVHFNDPDRMQGSPRKTTSRV